MAVKEKGARSQAMLPMDRALREGTAKEIKPKMSSAGHPMTNVRHRLRLRRKMNDPRLRLAQHAEPELNNAELSNLARSSAELNSWAPNSAERCEGSQAVARSAAATVRRSLHSRTHNSIHDNPNRPSKERRRCCSRNRTGSSRRSKGTKIAGCSGSPACCQTTARPALATNPVPPFHCSDSKYLLQQ
jgi:hypothetical protein